MEMIGQGWPLYAAVPGGSVVYAIVGWDTRDGTGDPVPLGVDLSAGSATAPYAVSVAHRHDRVVVTTDLRSARLLAAGVTDPDPTVRLLADEQRLRAVVRDLRDRLLSVAAMGFDISHRDDLREQVLAAAASVGEGLP